MSKIEQNKQIIVGSGEDMIGLLLFVGLAAGFIGTIIGAGGGFLIIPFLLLVSHFTPQHAVATSLSVVFLNTLSGSWAYARQKRIDYATAISFALATVPGSIAGAFLTRYFSGTAYRSFFGVFLLCVAAYLIYRTTRKEPVAEDIETAVTEEAKSPNDTGEAGPRKSLASKAHIRKVITDSYGHTYTLEYDLPFGIFASFVVGLLASLLGIGGGLIHVPMMVYLLGFPPHLATATSHLILAISSFFSAGTHVFLGNVDFKSVILLGTGAIIGAQFGAKIAHRIKGPWIIRGLAIALIFLSLRMLILA